MSAAVPRPSTTVLLIRDGAAGLEVLMVVRRSDQLAFAGALVFPGGTIDRSDADEAWLSLCDGTDSLDAEERVRRIAGFRELYEETGILLLDRPGGVSAQVDGQASFLDIVRQSGGRIDLSAMAPFAHWITPAHMPKRYDTHFQLCWQTTDMQAVCDGWEAVSVEWLRPAEAIRLGASAERNLLFPTQCQLELLEQSTTVAEAIDAARSRRIVPVLPIVKRRPEGMFVSIPAEAGYPTSGYRMPALAV